LAKRNKKSLFYSLKEFSLQEDIFVIEKILPDKEIAEIIKATVYDIQERRLILQNAGSRLSTQIQFL
jgi:hypothetical protein